MSFEQIIRYFGKKYDINGNVYELITSMPISRELVFQNVSDDTSITRPIDHFDLETYIR